MEDEIEFIREIDKLKDVFRHTSLFGKDRKENSAEHSWHVCMMALVLSKYSNENDLDMLKILKMLLIHDLVEIHAGDYIIYTEESEEKVKKEREGAEKIFGLLSNKKRDEFMSLWEEFEERESKEAKFARAIDRFEPILQNYVNGGGTWKEMDIPLEKILDKNKIIEDGSEEIWSYVKDILDEFIEKDIIKKM